MTKPPTSVRSIRLPDTMWAKLAARAEQTGSTVNALIAVAADLAVTVIVTRSEVEAAAAYDFRAVSLRAADTSRAKVTNPGKPKVPYGSRLKKR